MKRTMFLLLNLLLFASCGVGTYSVSSGKADEGMLSFVANKSYQITAVVDGVEYNVQTVKEKPYRKDRKIKPASLNTVTVSPGQHDVKVYVGNSEVYASKVFISASETKIINL